MPVKLYSFHLLMSCVILLLPDLSRLTRVLLLNLPTGPFTAPALLPVRWGKSAFFLKTVFVVVAVVQQTIEDRGEHLVAEDHGPTS